MSSALAGSAQSRERSKLLPDHGQRWAPQYTGTSLSLGAVSFLFLLGAALGAVATGSVLLLCLGLQQSAQPSGDEWDFVRDEQAVWSQAAQEQCTSGQGIADVDLSLLKGPKRDPRRQKQCQNAGSDWSAQRDPTCDSDPELVAWAMDTGGGQVDWSEPEDDLGWLPDSLANATASPWLEILEDGNRELESAVEALRQQSGPCFQSSALGQVLEAAMKKVEQQQDCGSPLAVSRAAQELEAELQQAEAALLREEAAAGEAQGPGAQQGSCSVDQALADQLIIPPSPPPPPLPDDVTALPVKERVAACFQMYELAEEVQLAEDIAYQIMLQEQREEMMRGVRLNWLRGLEPDREWWEKMNITAKQGQKRFKEMKDDDPEKGKLEGFLRGLLPFEDWWNIEGPQHNKSAESLAEQQKVVAEAVHRHEQRVNETEHIKQRLKQQCGLALPHSDWKEEQQRFLRKYQEVIEASGVEGYCIDWRTVAPEFEEQSSLHAPKKYWKKIPEVYPGWLANITFIVNWRSEDKAQLRRMWERLYKCTGGWTEGEGAIPNVKAEMLINVFNPEESLDVWLEGWHETDKARFVVPVLPNVKGDIAAYTTLVRIAHGDIIVLLRDGDEVPDSCTWLTEMLASFAAWPRLGVVGYTTEQPAALQDKKVGRIMKEWWEHGTALNKGQELKDSLTGVGMHFTGLVHSTPIAVRRTALLRLGNLDEKDPCAEQAAQAFFWQLCSRIWLSGFQVAKIHSDLPGDKSGKQATRNFLGGQGDSDCSCYAEYFLPYHLHVRKEVDRLNDLLH